LKNHPAWHDRAQRELAGFSFPSSSLGTPLSLKLRFTSHRQQKAFALKLARWMHLHANEAELRKQSRYQAGAW
jgi:hypothetical protein